MSDEAIGAVVVCFIVTAFVGAVVWSGMVGGRRDEACSSECHPRMSNIIDEVCHCATETGWERE